MQGNPEMQESRRVTPPAEELRTRLWRSRTRNSRAVGVALLVLSAALFALAFATGTLISEVSSLTAFVLGSLLLVASFEQRVTIFPAVEAVEGPVKAFVSLMEEKGWVGKAAFVPGPGGVRMTLVTHNSPTESIELNPYGHDLVEYYESQAGELKGRGLGFVEDWLPRVLTDAAGLVQSASVTRDKNEVSTKLVQPFVRPLCVKPFFTEKVCNSLGCPLINSIGEGIASATGDVVSHVRCSYDPLTQTATAVHEITPKV
jgi:hypothetical protein